MRMALVGDALSHVALPGLALRFLLNFNPLVGAFAFLFASIVLTGYLERVTRISTESIVGVLFVTSLAISILITPEQELLDTLFGDTMKVTLTGAVSAIVISILITFVMKISYGTVVLSLISEELAVSKGIKVIRVNLP